MDPQHVLAQCMRFEGEEEELQRVTLEDVEVLEIDHGSTTLFVETAYVEALEVSLLRSGSSAGAVVDQTDNRVKISLDHDITRMLNIGRMPQLRVKIPADYAGRSKLTVLPAR